MSVRGMLAAPVFESKFAAAIEAVDNLIWKEKASGRTDSIAVLPDMTFVKSGWQFTCPDTGEKYVETFLNMNEEELREVTSVFFYKVQELQSQIEQLQNKVRLMEQPALQLVG